MVGNNKVESMFLKLLFSLLVFGKYLFLFLCIATPLIFLYEYRMGEAVPGSIFVYVKSFLVFFCAGLLIRHALSDSLKQLTREKTD